MNQKNNGINKKITCLTFMGDVIFAGTGYYGIYLSSNLGDSWTKTYIGLASNRIHSLYPFNNYLFVGTTNGIYFTTNHGYSWTSISNGLLDHQKSIQKIEINDTYIYIVNSAGQIFRRKLSDIIISVDDENEIDPETELKTFPNPANEYIDIQLHARSNLSKGCGIKIFNTIGDCLINKEMIEPLPLNRIDVSDLPNGIYTILIQDNMKIITSKFIVLR